MTLEMGSGYEEDMGCVRAQGRDQVSIIGKYQARESEEGRHRQEGEEKAEQDAQVSVASGSEADKAAPQDVSNSLPTSAIKASCSIWCWREWKE